MSQSVDHASPGVAETGPAPDVSKAVPGGAGNIAAGEPASGWTALLDPARLDFSGAVELVDKGGPVVVILLAISIVALAVALLKAVHFLWWGVGRDRRVALAMALYEREGADAAAVALAGRKGPAATVVRHALDGLAHRYDETVVREDAERLATLILSRLRAGLRVLEAASQVAPLLGLFGTVIGMIAAFQTLQTAGAEADPSLLAGGIWVALLTTAVGLAVAIPAALALYWFEGRIEREATTMEDSLTRIFTHGLHAPLDREWHAGGVRAAGVANAAE